MAMAFAKQGAFVFVHGSDEEKCKKAADEIPNATATPEDLGADGCIDRLYEKTGDVDILILNASIQIRKAWDEITSEEFDKQIRVNYKSTVEAIQKYAPYMCKNKWGRIITVGSVQQYVPHKDMLVYASGKAAVMNMVQNLAKQLAPSGVTVNNLNPGVIATPRNEAALSDGEYAAKVMSSIPLGYAGEPEDMVGAALLLATDAGRYITGIDLLVDGGMHL